MILDCLITPGTNWKAKLLIEAVYEGALKADVDARIVKDGKVRADAHVALYGLGGADRIRFLGQPKVISFDAGYWERKLDVPVRKYRVSIGGFHCPDRIFRGPNPGPERWASAGLEITSRYDPNGPILLVGNGPKSNRIGAERWCADMSRKLREWFPGRTIWYRPKPKRRHDVDVDYDALAEKINIDSVLAQCSLVVCKHSNVAVDAARVGVPCLAEDGAGHSIYHAPDCMVNASWNGNGLPHMPDAIERAEFLHRLAWWQWSITEIREGKFWPWMLQELAR